MKGEWKNRKKHFLKRLREERAIGRVDEDIYPLLEAINSFDDYYTTSSCSGRIQIYASKLPGKKFEIKTLRKWHRTVTLEEVNGILNSCNYDNLWFAVLPPIIHVIAKDIESANRILHIAREAGFKHSGILSIKEERIVLELTSSERIEVPLIIDKQWIVDKNKLSKLIERANELLMVSKSKIKRFESLLRSENN